MKNTLLIILFFTNSLHNLSHKKPKRKLISKSYLINFAAGFVLAEILLVLFSFVFGPPIFPVKSKNDLNRRKLVSFGSKKVKLNFENFRYFLEISKKKKSKKILKILKT